MLSGLVPGVFDAGYFRLIEDRWLSIFDGAAFSQPDALYQWHLSEFA